MFNDANAATHLKAVMEWGAANKVDYYYFEAYDEAWKNNQPFEPYFGIWDASMNLKSAFQSILDN